MYIYKLEYVIGYKDRIHKVIEGYFEKLRKLNTYEVKPIKGKINQADVEAIKAQMRTILANIDTAAAHLNEVKVAMTKANGNSFIQNLFRKKSQNEIIFEDGELARKRRHLKELLATGKYLADVVNMDALEKEHTIIERLKNRYNRKKTVKLSFKLETYLKDPKAKK